jgi:hypothetical protein
MAEFTKSYSFQYILNAFHLFFFKSFKFMPEDGRLDRNV